MSQTKFLILSGRLIPIFLSLSLVLLLFSHLFSLCIILFSPNRSQRLCHSCYVVSLFCSSSHLQLTLTHTLRTAEMIENICMVVGSLPLVIPCFDLPCESVERALVWKIKPRSFSYTLVRTQLNEHVRIKCPHFQLLHL